MDSFEALGKWKDDFIKHTGPKNPNSFPFIVLGNKADKLKEKSVSMEKVKEWCEKNGNSSCFETSAKDHINVLEAFEQAARLALANSSDRATANKSSGKSHKLAAGKVEKQGCC
eukprot:TRINITY_DN6283_c0_g1_i13.p1 TRINITY_DN6283_c0_g1~~TRINITY_DN6283_c0_g1_i13.p1  ORF type:complete len:114 (-),score=39.33 TRINITY_DN6283_c0_g1_i13:56-397(-)